MDEHRNPWDRQPHEPASSYELFLGFLSQPDGTSIAAYGRELGRPSGSLHGLARRWSWAIRRAAYRRSILEARKALSVSEWHRVHEKQQAAWYMLLDLCQRELERIAQGPAHLGVKDLAQVLKMVTEMQRLMQGLVTERRSIDLSAHSDEELEVLEALLTKGKAEP